MPAAVAEQISLFRSFIEEGSYSDVSLRILETLLVAKDVRALLEIRSTLQELLRSEVTSVMARIAAKSADEKLDIAEFFVKAFALVGDVESCLALKYEALVLRESKYYNNDDFRVSYQEWYTFAKDSLHNRYYSIAVKGFDSALSCFQSEHNTDGVTRDNHVNDHIVDKIIRLRDEASAMVSSRSGHFGVPPPPAPPLSQPTPVTNPSIAALPVPSPPPDAPPGPLIAPRQPLPLLDPTGLTPTQLPPPLTSPPLPPPVPAVVTSSPAMSSPAIPPLLCRPCFAASDHLAAYFVGPCSAGPCSVGPFGLLDVVASWHSAGSAGPIPSTAHGVVATHRYHSCRDALPRAILAGNQGTR